MGSRISEDRPLDLLQNFHFTSRYPVIKFFDLHHFCIKRLVCFKLCVTDGLLNNRCNTPPPSKLEKFSSFTNLRSNNFKSPLIPAIIFFHRRIRLIRHTIQPPPCSISEISQTNTLSVQPKMEILKKHARSASVVEREATPVRVRWKSHSGIRCLREPERELARQLGNERFKPK